MHIGVLIYKEPLKLMGRHIANKTFLDALVKYAGEHRITILDPSMSDIPTFLKENPLDVLHYPGPDLYRALSLKAYNPKPMAVTGITHTLGHAPFMEWAYMNAFAGVTTSDALICTSKAAKDALNQMPHIPPFGFNLPIIPLGIDSSSYFKAPKKDDVIRLLYLGRFCKYTKVDLFPLLEMVKEVMSKTDKKIELTLAGADTSGYARELNKKSVEIGLNNLRFALNVTEEQKRQLLSESDIFLAPSNNTQETFGLSLLEAMASGLPIIAYDWSGYRDIVKDGFIGYRIATTLKPKGEILPFQYDALNQKQFSDCVEVDKEDFIKKTLALIENDSLREEMSHNTKDIIQIYEWNNIIPQYLGLWERLSSEATASTSNLKTLDYFKVFSHYATNTQNL